jgi:hypothetical protein
MNKGQPVGHIDLYSALMIRMRLNPRSTNTESQIAVSNGVGLKTQIQRNGCMFMFHPLKKSYPLNRTWSPIVLGAVKNSTLSRQSARRWR